jgi:hypothetical protein
MNWFKTILTVNQSAKLQEKFSKLFAQVPRPQKAFLYAKEDGIVKTTNGINELFTEVYFTPECKIFMPELLNEYNAVECEKPNKEDLIGICLIEDFEHLIWN